MITQLKQYDQEQLKSIYARGSLFSDKKQIKEISNVVTKQQNALTAIITYNNNILKIADSVKLGSQLIKRKNVLEKQANDNSLDLDTTNLISSLQNLTDLVGKLSEKLKMTDLSSGPSIIPSTQNKMSLGKVGKALAVAGVAIAGVSLLSNMSSPSVDQTSDKLGKTANKAVRTAEQRSETIKVSENSFANQFASFIGNVLRYGLLGGILGTMGGAIGGMLGSEDYSNLEPAGDSAHAGQAMQYFMSQGWTKEQAAGIVGNLQAESGANLDSNAVGDGGRAYGIAQWHADRQANFTNKAKYGKIAGSSFEDQLKFVQWELNNTESAAGKALKSARTPQEAAEIIDRLYERSAGIHRGQRIANAVALAGGKFEANQISSNRNLATSEAPRGTIWKGKDEDGLITFVSKSNDPSTGKIKYETWTNQDSKHYTISEQDANTQIRTRGLKSNNTKPQTKKTSGSSLSGYNPRDLLNFTARTGDEAHFNRLNPETKRAVLAAAAEYKQRTGNKLTINSAHRSYDEQKYLYEHPQGHIVAYPGTSAHETGWSVDIDQHDSVAREVLGKHGMQWYGSGDDVHYTLRGHGEGGGQATAQQAQPKSQELPKSSTQVAIQKAKQKKMAPTIIAKNNIIRQQVKAPTVLSQASGKTNHVRKPMEYFEYLVG
jgi:hypothetical protein